MGSKEYVILDGPVGWSDVWEREDGVELDGYMIADLRSYREGLFMSMLSTFEEQCPTVQASMHSALSASDFDSLMNAAHLLAGSSVYVGASSLAAHARGIERCARERDAAGAASLLALLGEHMAGSLTALRELAAE